MGERRDNERKTEERKGWRKSKVRGDGAREREGDGGEREVGRVKKENDRLRRKREKVSENS